MRSIQLWGIGLVGEFIGIWFLLLYRTCLRQCGWAQANLLMLLILWKNIISLIGWSDGFDLLWNCIQFQKWVYVCIRQPIWGVLEWIWWGSTPQFLERIGFQYRGQLRKNIYLLAKVLVAFGLVCYLGTLKTIFHDSSVHGAHEFGYLLLFDIVTPEPLCFRSLLAFWCMGVIRVHPYNGMPCAGRTDVTGTHTVHKYRCWDGLWD